MCLCSALKGYNQCIRDYRQCIGGLSSVQRGWVCNDHNILPNALKPGFHMIVGDRSRSLGSLVNCSAIVTILWKPNFHFASDHQRSQRLPTTATITIAGIESESISAIIAIVNDRQRSQKDNGNHQCSDCSDRNDRNDPSDHMETIAQRSQRS